MADVLDKQVSSTVRQAHGDIQVEGNVLTVGRYKIVMNDEEKKKLISELNKKN